MKKLYLSTKLFMKDYEKQLGFFFFKYFVKKNIYWYLFEYLKEQK